MHLVEVIPIARAIAKEKLTYFCKDAPPMGSIVTIPLRGRKIKGIVSDVSDARSERSAIKSAEFELKKIESFSPQEIIPRGFSETARTLSKFYITTQGSVLSSILPHTIIQHPEEVPALEVESPSKSLGTKKVTRTTIVRGALEDRISNYRSALRECFAQKKSVYLCTPTIEDAEQMAEELSRGIEQYVFLLHSELPKKKTIETWNAIHAADHPVLIVGTPIYISVPRQDLGLIIIEREGSRAYHMQSRPYIDMRRLASIYAHTLGADLMRGDMIVSTESWWLAQDNVSGTIEYREERPEHLPDLSLIDMKAKLEEKTPFKTISPELHELIKRTLRDKKRLFLFTPRKGLFPTTVCGDCGTVVLCSRCSAPVVVHKGTHEDEYVFLCHHCGRERPTEERCKHCDSWKLAAVGIGIERVFDDIVKEYPDAPVMLLDKNSEPTRAKARKKVERFKSTPGAILIGTEYSLLYMPEVEHSAIVSLDSLFLIPDFRMNERILGIMTTIQSKTRDAFIIQSRTPTHPLFGHLSRKTMRDFYHAEAEERRILSYPPFSFCIKLTRAGKEENVRHDIEHLETKLKRYDVSSYPGRIERVRNAFIMHLLLKLQPEDWVDETVSEILSTLPPQWSIKVDPDSLL